MGSTCPKCHQVVEEDYVCCADVRYTWKCAGCGKRTTGFVVPFGSCPLCGGALSVVEGHELPDPSRVRPIQQALQFEANAHTFYRLAGAHAQDSTLRGAFEGLAQMAAEHVSELAEKYHAHLPDVQRAGFSGQWIRATLFQELASLPAERCLEVLYEKAIAMERGARAFFMGQMATLPEGTEREIYRELAAEEDEHIALLETEWQHTREVSEDPYAPA